MELRNRREYRIWAAALFDGEGSITLRRYVDRRVRAYKERGVNRRSVRFQLHVEVNQVRPEAVEILHRQFGGRLAKSKPRGKYTGRYFWLLDSGRAAAFLGEVAEFLTIKKSEALLAIRFQRLKLAHGTGRGFKLGLTEEEISERTKLYQELRALKRIHYNGPLASG